MNVIIIEDSPEVAAAVSLCLQIRWPEVGISIASLGLEGVKLAESRPCDIILLDLNLPDIDGLEVLRQIRSFSDVPTIILTVRESEDDQVKGLEMGADDYITKPFRPRDLVARVRAVLRRARTAPVVASEFSITQGGLTLDVVNNTVEFRQQTIDLTLTESRLLHTLMNSPGKLLSNELLLEKVWGEGHTNINLVRTYVKRLRSKLGDRPPSIILNDHGNGYRFNIPGEASFARYPLEID